MYRLIILFTFFTVGLFAHDSIEIHNKNINIVKSGYFKTEDKTNPEELVKLFRDNKFTPFAKKAKSIGFFGGEIWYGFEIDSLNTKESLYINIKDPTKERAYLYIFKDGKLIESSQDGYLVPLQHKDLKTFGATFKLLKNTKALYLIKTTSSHPHYNSFAFGIKEDIEKYWDIYYAISILVSGIFIALILYNLFLYFMIKDRAYIFYIVYMSGLYITNELLYGYLQVVLPEHLDLTTLFLALSIQIGITGLVFFTEHFLDMNMANDKKLILINRTLLLSTIISMFLIPMANGFQPVAIFFLQVLNVSLLFTGYKKYKSGHISALFYLLATGVGLITMIIFSLMSQGVIFNYNLLTFHISSVGLVWDMVLLSLALAYKVRLIQKKNLEQERLLMIQSRYENIGEITGNIAHQWRTPLGRLGSIFSKLILKLEHNSLENKELQKSLHQSNETIQYLSQTIDTFQSLFNYTSNTKNLNLKQFLYKLIEFIKEYTTFENINIKADEIEEIILNTNENELSQILLSILVNAKDALIQNNIKNPYIKISTINTQKTLSIKVEDNGGGIQIKPIEKIFEPHFSNKENGSGLGLYIAKIIAQKNDMELRVENTDGGARFVVEIKSQ